VPKPACVEVRCSARPIEKIPFLIVLGVELKGLKYNTAGIVIRSTDRDTSALFHRNVTLPAINHQQFRVVRLRRDATHWFATVDGQSVGSLKQSGPGENAEICLSVVDGPAWFSDIEVQELVEPSVPSTST